jgi:hypothetical protein
MSSRSKGKNKEKVIELVFPENFLKSLNKIYDKQNQELMKAIAEDKLIPVSELLKIVYNQNTVDIFPIG